MKLKTTSLYVIMALLIVGGLIMSFWSSMAILEEASHKNGNVNSNETLTIASDFDPQNTEMGVFAIQIIDYKKESIVVKVLDPSDIEIISHTIDTDRIEEKFNINYAGEYKLIVESDTINDVLVFAYIGPFPDDITIVFSYVSIYMILAGLVGVVCIVVFNIKKKRS